MTRRRGRPSGFGHWRALDAAPLAFSFAALATAALHVARVGFAPGADEGLSAHLWWLLMGATAVSGAIGARRRWHREGTVRPRLVAAQILCAATAVVPVALLGL